MLCHVLMSVVMRWCQLLCVVSFIGVSYMFMLVVMCWCHMLCVVLCVAHNDVMLCVVSAVVCLSLYVSLLCCITLICVGALLDFILYRLYMYDMKYV